MHSYKHALSSIKANDFLPNCLRFSHLAAACIVAFCLLVLSMTVLPATAALAQQPDHGCSNGLDCRVGVPVGWGGGVMQKLLLRDTGGQIDDATNHVHVAFEGVPLSNSLVVQYESADAHSVVLETPNIGLGAFHLTRKIEGIATTQHIATQWQMQFIYPECNEGEPCMDTLFDETSMTCLFLDAANNVWMPLESRVNVLSNVLECSSAELGEFVIVAQPVRTSGEGDAMLFLPVVTG